MEGTVDATRQSPLSSDPTTSKARPGGPATETSPGPRKPGPGRLSILADGGGSPIISALQLSEAGGVLV